MIKRHPYILTLLALALLILSLVIDAVFVRLPSVVFLIVLIAVIILCAVSYRMIKKKCEADLKRDMDAKKKKLGGSCGGCGKSRCRSRKPCGGIIVIIPGSFVPILIKSEKARAPSRLMVDTKIIGWELFLCRL